MAIKITDKHPDVEVTSEEYRQYSADYQKSFTHYSGTPPSLEEFIRGRQEKPKLLNG